MKACNRFLNFTVKRPFGQTFAPFPKQKLILRSWKFAGATGSLRDTFFQNRFYNGSFGATGSSFCLKSGGKEKTARFTRCFEAKKAQLSKHGFLHFCRLASSCLCQWRTDKYGTRGTCCKKLMDLDIWMFCFLSKRGRVQFSRCFLWNKTKAFDSRFRMVFVWKWWLFDLRFCQEREVKLAHNLVIWKMLGIQKNRESKPIEFIHCPEESVY